MPINNITQTISTIPEAAHRGVDVQTIFVTKQEDFQDHLQGVTVNELNTLKDQLNSRIGEINSTATTMNGYATSASSSASTATAKAGEASTSASSASMSASQALTSRNQAETFAQQASASALSVDVNNIVHRTGNETIAGVKTFSSNIVADGSVTIKGVQDSAIISATELVTNGTFTGNAAGWTLGAGWVYSANTVVCTLGGTAEGTVSQNVAVVSGKTYILSWAQTNSIDTNAHITPSLGAVVSKPHSSGTTAQVYTVIFKATDTGNLPLTFTVTDITSTGTITLDNVTLKEITKISPTLIMPTNTAGAPADIEMRVVWNGINYPNFGIGNSALANNTTGYANTAVGNGALQSNTTGYYNTANGANALQNNTTGYYNTANGASALQSNTTGSHNTANGLAALQSNTTGYYNTANGANALQNNTTGYYNTANGASALANNTTGYANTANGLAALQSNTTGYYNTANGASALQSNTTGYYNTANGANALQNNTTGNYNTASGLNALQSNTTYSNVSGFGYNSQVTGSNQVQLGDSATTTYVYGTVGNRSDIRDKADIRDTILGLDFINKLRPVDYKWDMREDYKPEKPTIEVPDINDEDYETKKAEYDLIINKWLEDCKFENIVRDGSKKRTRYHQGFIAQEVLALSSDFGGIQDHNVKGGEDVLSIGYDEIIAPLVKAVQEQQAMIDLLKSEINILKGAK